MLLALALLPSALGTPVRLVTVDGPGAVTVHDATGGVLSEARLPDLRLRSIIAPEGGGEAIRVPSAVARVDWPDGAVSARVGGRPAAALPPPPAEGTVEGLVVSGPSEERLDLVLLGDGYTAAQLDRFADDADRLVAYLLELEPYDRYAPMFNVWRVDRASAESGGSHPGVARDTAYGCAYGCGDVDRLICCDSGVVLGEVAAAVPGADGVLVLVNDPTYGGSGGFDYASAYTGTDFGLQVAAHELGHSLVGLWDEYDYGLEGTIEAPNCSAKPTGSWDEWLGTDGVDAFPVCSLRGSYRPTDEGCMMRTLEHGYCPVCRERVVEAIYERIPELVSRLEPEPGRLRGDVVFEVDAVEPIGGLRHEWTVEGEVLVEDDPSFALACSGARGELALRIWDDTPWLRRAVIEETHGPWDVRAKRCARACGCGVGRSPGWAALVALLLTRARGVRVGLVAAR